MLSLQNVIFLSAVLFAIGAYGVLARRNLLVILMSIELMLNAVNLTIAGFSRHFAAGGLPLAAGAKAGSPGFAEGGQVFVMMSMAVAACEVAVGLGLLIALFRTKESVITMDLAELKG